MKDTVWLVNVSFERTWGKASVIARRRSRALILKFVTTEGSRATVSAPNCCHRSVTAAVGSHQVQSDKVFQSRYPFVGREVEVQEGLP